MKTKNTVPTHKLFICGRYRKKTKPDPCVMGWARDSP